MYLYDFQGLTVSEYKRKYEDYFNREDVQFQILQKIKNHDFLRNTRVIDLDYFEALEQYCDHVARLWDVHNHYFEMAYWKDKSFLAPSLMICTFYAYIPFFACVIDEFAILAGKRKSGIELLIAESNKIQFGVFVNGVWLNE